MQDLRHIIAWGLYQIPIDALMSGNMAMAIMGQTRLHRHVWELFGAEGHPAMDGHDVIGQGFATGSFPSTVDDGRAVGSRNFWRRAPQRLGGLPPSPPFL